MSTIVQHHHRHKAPAFAAGTTLSAQRAWVPTERRTICARQRSRRKGPVITMPSANASNPMPTTSTKNKYHSVTWGKVERLAKQLVQAMANERFDAILGITRGGLVPATLISEALEIRNVVSATVFFYTDDGEQYFGVTEPRFLAFPGGDALQGRKVLIVDDVWDTGRTAHAVKQRALRANPALVKVAVLHYKPEMNTFAEEEPDFYAETTSDWIVYPWEYASPRAPPRTLDRSVVVDQENIVP